MELTAEQLAKLRVPFEETGAFVGLPEEEIKRLLEGMVDIYITLARINLRSKQKTDAN